MIDTFAAARDRLLEVIRFHGGRPVWDARDREAVLLVLREVEAARAEGFLAGIEAAARLVENHCCVSSCCDAQPSGGEAKALAECLRKRKERAE